MADSTPDAGTPAATPATKPAAKKPAKKPARKPAGAKPAAPESVPASASAAPAPAPDVAAPAAPAAPRTSHASGGSGSFLDRVRANRMGPLTAGLLVAIVLGLLLSVLVPNSPGALAMTLLGVLVAAGVGCTVRYLSDGAALRHQVEAFLAALVGVHLMSVTGVVGGELPLVSNLGIDGPGLNEALLVAFATAPVSTGGLLAGLTAAIIVGWGARTTLDD